MRRTDQEFKNEVLRRKDRYRSLQKQRLKGIGTAALCLVLVIFGSVLSMPFLSGMGAGAAPESVMAPDGVFGSAAEAPAAQATDINESLEFAQVRAVRIDGRLYLDTGFYNGSQESGSLDGEITSSVERTRMPEENDQSNFGSSFGYRFGSLEGTVEIYMNGNWRIFATEEAMASLEIPE